MPIQRNPKTGEPFIDPARLRTPITFLEATQASDSSGAAVSWAPATPPDTAWAEIIQDGGTEVIQSGQDISNVTARATIRYVTPGRQASMRFQDDAGVMYVIKAVKNIDPGCRIYQELVCQVLGENV
jgi:head-tail adaptor